MKWGEVPGYNGRYEISDDGQVRTADGRFLKPKRATNGYLYCDFSSHGEKTRYLLHRLVAIVHIGWPPSAGAVINHLNADRTDNRVCNLEWTSYKGNAIHTIRSGRANHTPLPGEKNGRSKLTEQQVEEIRSQKGNIGARELARMYGVSRSAIQFIHQGKHWKPADLRVRQFPEVGR